MIEVVGDIVGAGSAALLGSGVWLGWALRQYQPSAVNPAEVSLVPARKYQTLERLTSSADLAFLRTRPGFSPEVEKKFLRDRRQAFRSYLKELAADFQRLHKAARELVAVAPEEHSGLIEVLFKQQITFWRTLAIIEVRLALHWAGVPAVDLSGLRNCVETLQFAVAKTRSFA